MSSGGKSGVFWSLEGGHTISSRRTVVFSEVKYDLLFWFLTYLRPG